jgi:hypothetical protein
MIRSLLAFLGLIIVGSSTLVMLPTIILPDTFAHQIIPFFAPLHEMMACKADETIEYHSDNTLARNDDITRFFCVNAAGESRNVNHEIRTPGSIASMTCLVGVGLLFFSLFLTLRAGKQREFTPQTQQILQSTPNVIKQGWAEMQSMSEQNTPSTDIPPLTQSGTEQLAVLDQLLAKGLISQSSYEISRQAIIQDNTKKP